MFGRDKLEVDGVNDRPYFPRSLASREKVAFHFVNDGRYGISIDQTKISKEDRHENRAPDELINTNLQSNMLSFFSLDLLVKPVVEKVTRRTVVDETEDTKSDESFHVEWPTTNEDLSRKHKNLVRE